MDDSNAHNHVSTSAQSKQHDAETTGGAITWESARVRHMCMHTYTTMT